MDIREILGGGEQLELVVAGETIVVRRTRRLHLEGVLLIAADHRGVANPCHRCCRWGGTAIQPDNTDPHQTAKELEELEDGHY